MIDYRLFDFVQLDELAINFLDQISDGIELESLRQVFDAVEKQLPDHGKFKLNIGGIRIDTNNLNSKNIATLKATSI